VALLGAFIAATSALHATAVENTLSVPMPDFQTPAQLAKWRAETTAKTVAKEAAQTASSRLSTVDSSTFSLNSGVPTPLAPPQGSGAARSSQSNQLPPVAGFYTGKPYLAESGSYAFKYREYNPETARWTTIDPSGFPDGANNRVYVPNPTSEFDSLGKQVSMVYSITSQTLTVHNNDNNKSYSFSMMSGDNNPNNENQLGGPIPEGNWSVYTYNEAGQNFHRTGYGAFILDYNDSTPKNDIVDNSKYNTQNGPRDAFRLHEGSSDGCVSTANASDFTSIYNILMGTSHSSQLVNLTSPGGAPNSFSDYLIGTLSVKE